MSTYPSCVDVPLIPFVPVHDANADATGRPFTRGVPKVSTPFAAGWMPVPAFAEFRPPFIKVELQLRERRMDERGAPRAVGRCAARRCPIGTLS